ncbi:MULTISPECIES: protoporphyrinogen oxidase [unclassified Paenibacillus]|uniref:protoporphyrinogen oxidase n=1 Tax=unclassified Paenibacillus TaxID=185978 RepID=UPI0009564D31|nr:MULTISPECIES: protoporphyrinogen oxidase [unclassified Paenibacillus]ASS64853.1 protoporphyrinogen oxidase [Paenibacillus sp. RUD330]SIR03727.1 oxygen-dependent protoporphyrinogen oxidase [Paenibacillus sp. RU4X]SIR31597.1 oxygen-dependent protoporphyrinogen oxidase [Paenibacillus sp. RU4T]
MNGGTRALRIVVVGGGLTGLSAAHYIRKGLEERNLEGELVLVEAGERLGGRIETLRKDGFTIEKGPDSFLARKLPILELTRELGLLDELVRTNPQAAKTYIYQGGQLHPMPPKLVLGVPADMAAFLKTELLGTDSKFRASCDLLLAPRPDDGEDESVGAFLERRMGPDIVDRISEPLLAGIYAGDLYNLSLAATFPQFRRAELEHGSLIRGSRAGSRGAAPPAPPDYLPESVKGSVFMTYRHGLRTLVEGLERSLEGERIRMGTTVSSIRESGGGGRRYELELGSGETLEADAVIVTAPGQAAASMLEPLADMSELREVKYVSVANVVMAFTRRDVEGMEFDGSGFLVPRSEGRTITACTWTSSKWLHSSPSDHVLLRCYVGRAGAEEAVELSDEELTAAVLRDVKDTMGIEVRPLFTEITRLRRSMPQYPVGHVAAMGRLRSRMAEQSPGVYATGAAFDGVGLPDCIRQGREAAQHVLGRFQ